MCLRSCIWLARTVGCTGETGSIHGRPDPFSLFALEEAGHETSTEEDLSSDCGQSVTRSVLYMAKRIKDKVLAHGFSPPWIQRYTEQLLLRAAKVSSLLCRGKATRRVQGYQPVCSDRMQTYSYKSNTQRCQYQGFETNKRWFLLSLDSESLSGPGMSSTIWVIVNSESKRELQVARSVRLKVSATLTYTGGDDFLYFSCSVEFITLHLMYQE